MRIIAGRYKGRRLDCPPSRFTRPSSGRLKEAIFSILESYCLKKELSFKSMTVMDAFAGSGALGLEALSRGAKKVFFIENNLTVFKILEKNVNQLGEEVRENVFLLKADSPRLRRSFPDQVDVLFLDPPYGKGLIFKTIDHFITLNLLKNSCLFVCERSCKEQDLIPENLELISEHCYGDSQVLLLKTKIF